MRGLLVVLDVLGRLMDTDWEASCPVCFAFCLFIDRFVSACSLCTHSTDCAPHPSQCAAALL